MLNQIKNLLEVIFNCLKTESNKVQMAIAKVGHDTPKHKTSSEVYGKLPDC